MRTAGKTGNHINGDYVFDGKHNSKNKYKRIDAPAGMGNPIIYFDGYKDWKINGDDDTNSWVYKARVDPESDVLPEYIWETDDTEMLPCPRVIDEWLKRYSAVHTFRRLTRDELAEHADKITDLLLDVKDLVRREVVVVLGNMEPAALERYAELLGQRCWEDEKEAVREAAVKVLGKLEPTVLAKHAAVIVGRIGDESSWVRYWALVALQTLDPALIEEYEETLDKVAHEDDYMPTREKAWQIKDEIKKAASERLKEAGEVDPDAPS